MMILKSTLPAALLASTLLLPGCTRDTGEAGVKTIGVGYEPGDLYRAPVARGGVIDYALVQLVGTGLDLGATGFFASNGAFTDPTADPFELVLGFSYFFSPAITAADQLSLISPKGPEVEDSCFVQFAGGGPLGSFRTVDVGDRLSFIYDGDAEGEGEQGPSRFEISRSPQDYPENASDVFSYYIGTANLVRHHSLMNDNWAFDRDVHMHFDGGMPPENAPLASIPRPSHVADPRVGKDEGDPMIYAPAELTGVRVSNEADGNNSVAMRYQPDIAGLPNPLELDGVLDVTWDAPPEDALGSSVITISLGLLPIAEVGEKTEDGEFCTAAAADSQIPELNEQWLVGYNAGKSRWCDPGYEPDPNIGNDEFGIDYLGDDTCHDGLDSDGDGTCDEGGCFDASGDAWLWPDPDCARHTYQVAYCGDDNLCRPYGGDLGNEGGPSWQTGELICTATDNGHFQVSSEDIATLIGGMNMELVDGALLKVSRTSEDLITVPMVRNPVGNQDNINPVRLRASQVKIGRVAWE